MRKEKFIIDGWLIAPEEGTLTRGEEITRLEPKAMEVLAYFASRPGEVITRDELERDVWRGALVGYDAVTATVIKVRKALNDSSRQPRIIATIPKRGYQLIADIKAPEQTAIPTGNYNRPHTSQVLRSNKNKLAWILALMVLVVAIILWSTQIELDKNEVPAILVLPFKNLDDHSKQTEFVNSFTEDIVTDLSRLSNLSVYASTTTFRFRERNVTPKAIREEIGADYVVQGSLRRMNDSIRINVVLIDTKTGFNKWAERYERNSNDFFSIQDELTNGLIQALAIKTSKQEQQNLAQHETNNLKAYDYFIEGQTHSKVYTKQSNEQAREAYFKAIKADPEYGRAYGATAFTLAVDFLRGWTDKPVETLDRALALAEKGVALNDAIPQTFWSLGYVHLIRMEFEQAEQVTRQSIRIAPNYADSYGLLALINNHIGNPDKALDYVNKGMQLNPYYTWDYLYNKGRAYYHLGQYDEAVLLLEKATERNENVVPVKLMLAASYVRSNRLDDAEWIIEQLHILNPATTISHIKKSIPIGNDELREKFLNDLRQAGLPEN